MLPVVKEQIKRSIKNKSKMIKKMVIESYRSIITLTVNGLNAPTKRHRLAGWMKNVHICTSTYQISLLNYPDCM